MHEVTNKHVVYTFVALIALALSSFGLSFVPMGNADLVVALTIAAAKATLVALFFMGLIEQRVANRFIFLVTVLFIALIVGLTGLDVVTRQTFPRGPSAMSVAGQATP